MKYSNLNVQMLIHGNLMILLVRIKVSDFPFSIYFFSKVLINVIKQIMKSFFAHLVAQQLVDLIQQQHNHQQAIPAMDKDLIPMVIGVTVVVYVRKVKELVVPTHTLVIRNQCINVTMVNLDPNKKRTFFCF
jgi:hypothetical protein